MAASISFSSMARARATTPRADATGHTLGGAALSLAAHAGVLGALSLAVLAPLQEAARLPATVALVFAQQAPAPVTPTTRQIAEAALPPLAPLTVAREVAAPAPGHYAATARLRRVPQAASPVPVKAAGMAPAPPAAAALAPAPEDVTGLKLQIQRAVQEAAVYPPRARLMRRQGRAQVRFDYTDGSVADVALAQSSHSPMLDQAALEAVMRAAYPKAKAQARLALLVWVNFGVAAD